MAKKEATKFDGYVEAQKAKAQEGAELLAMIEPELEWQEVKDLVGDRVLIMTVDDDEPKFGERKLRCTCVDEKDKAFRFSTEHGALIRNIDALIPYLPVWVEIEMTTSGKGREYFHLQKKEADEKEEEPNF